MEKFYINIIRNHLVFSLIVSSILYSYEYINYSYSFLLGTFISIIYFSMQVISVKALLSKNILIKLLSAFLWARYIILALIYILIIKSNVFNFYMTLIPILILYIFYALYFYINSSKQ